MRVPVATRTRAGMSIFVNAARVVLLAGCLLIPCRGVWAAQQTRDGRQAVYTSYRDIPGVTAEETAAIADLQKQRASFLFAMPLSAECFLTENGTFGGFSVLFCDWLSKLFGIPFKVQSSTWEGLLAGLQSRQIDFTGEITPTPERQTRYLTTDPIATRAIKVMQKADSPEFTKLSKDGPLRLGFLRDATVRSLLVPFLPQKFTPVPAADYADAYAMLRNGEIDAVFAEGPFEIPVETLEDGIVLRNFFPLVYSKVALSTANPELAPIISVVQKYLRNDDSGMLSAMYRQGIRDYMKNKLRLRLNEVEKNYLLDKRISGEAVAVAMEHDNYPLCFFNERAKEWQGIAVDVLKEIGKLTELRFEPANRPGADRVSLLDMLRRGEAPMTVELVKLTTQSDEFLWSSIPYFSDYYAVLSMADREDIGINRIESLRVGLLSNTTHARAFLDWFPDHGNTVYYPSADAGFDALENGEADLLMGSRNLLLGATHYYERPNFRENLLFQYEYGSFFGFNRDQAVLRAIVDKALPLINTAGIADGWMRRVFDYRGKLARGTMPYLIGISFLLVCVLIMLTVLHVQKRETGRRLEAEVRERTRELEVQTRQAQVASQAKSDFLSSMSHEIRTPMNAIIGIADLMRTDNLDETQREYLAGIKKTSGSLLNIINDILDFSKIEAGKMTLVRTHYNLFALFDNIRSITEFFAAEKALRLECGIDENLPRLLYGDEGRVRQIVMNLVSNAVKYTRKGHVSLRFRRTVKNEREYLSITVEDTGIGIRQEDFPRLFESFEQLDKNKNRGIAGTGLGLAVT
ncbi:MAG: transporter substrate-binding domain-containing protein, partial [Desulfovibrio sp.]|nr:transporter substrate-binding domain-containing protein [Desulfovibrio sp.]